MADYFVDQTGGSDSNDGLSTGAAWKTISKVNGETFSAGDTISFKRGEIWREHLLVPSSGSSGNPITIGAYGTGDDPIISGSNLITGWTADGGVSDVWNATVTTQPRIVYFDGVRGTLAASKEAISAPGEWFWASNVLSVYSTSDADSAFTNPGVEAGQRNQTITTNNKIHLTFDHITCRDGNQTNFGHINVGSATVTGIVFQNMTVERGNYSGFDVNGSSTADDITIDNCIVRANGAWGIVVINNYTTGIIRNCEIYENGWASFVNNQQYSGIQGRLGNFEIHDNTIHDNITGTANATDQSHGVYVGANSVGLADIHDNEIYGHPNGSGVKVTVTSADIYRNLIHGNGLHGIESGQNGAANVTYHIYQNVVYGNNAADVTGVGIMEGTKGGGTLTMIVENNTIYQNAGTTTQEFSVGNDLTALTLKNNLIVTTAGRRTMRLATQTGTVAIDNNLHWRADGNPNLFHGSDKTWEQWQGLGFDTNGVLLDPLLVNPTTDLKLQATSPAINAGTDVNLASDFIGTAIPQGAAPDIGAYEFIPSAGPTASPVMF